MTARLFPIFRLSAVLALAAAFSLQGQTRPGELVPQMQAKIEASIQAVTADQEAIEAEKLPLLRRISSMEEEIRVMEARLINLREMSKITEREISALQQDRAEFDSQAQYIISILREYTDTFESRLHVAEDQAYLDRLTDIREAIDSSPSPEAATMMRTLEIGLERLPRVTGGQEMPARAVLPDGSIEEGESTILGPTAYFASTTTPGVAGVLSFQPNSIEPELIVLGPEFTEPIVGFSQTNQGLLPFDSTLGKALAVTRERETVVAHIRKGGPVAIVILVLGGVALLFGLVKIWDLRALRIPPLPKLKTLARHARAGDLDTASAEARAIAGDAGPMLEQGIREGNGDTVRMEEIMLGYILKRKPALERFLPFVAMTAAAAPLLGLLGTVVGMIKTFTLITVFGSGDAKALSSGISEALITTELGLIVAVPALLIHGLFSRRVRAHIAKLEEIATDFLLMYGGPSEPPGDAADAAAAPAPVSNP